MFVALADRDNVDQVMTARTLEFIVRTLLYHTFPEADRERALIAELFINEGFEYLRKNTDVGTLSHERTINEALDVVGYLVRHLKEDSEEGE
jgi:hypothetical protein